MNQKVPFVSVIIPSRNEGKFIGQCLDSIIAQNYPKEKIEILVVDGMSEDNTVRIVKEYHPRYSFINLLENPKKITPCALNIGIKNAKGEIIIRMDAHAGYENNYIAKCVKYLKEYDADNVGGSMVTLPKENTSVARAIAFCLSHFFGTGGSAFRVGSTEPRWVDTVFGGCYKKEVFNKVGFFSENLVRSQDMEFNIRLKSAGGKILLVPEIVSYYYPKSDLKDFFIHNFEDGIWAVYPMKFIKTPLKLRHYIPLFFVLGLLGTGLAGIFISVFWWLFAAVLGLYLLFALYFSIPIAVKQKDIKYLFVMPVTFACRHFGYGLGSIWGGIKLLLPKNVPSVRKMLIEFRGKYD